jgi:hypothetical protein
MLSTDFLGPNTVKSPFRIDVVIQRVREIFVIPAPRAEIIPLRITSAIPFCVTVITVGIVSLVIVPVVFCAKILVPHPIHGISRADRGTIFSSTHELVPYFMVSVFIK